MNIYNLIFLTNMLVVDKKIKTFQQHSVVVFLYKFLTILSLAISWQCRGTVACLFAKRSSKSPAHQLVRTQKQRVCACANNKLRLHAYVTARR